MVNGACGVAGGVEWVFDTHMRPFQVGHAIVDLSLSHTFCPDEMATANANPHGAKVHHKGVKVKELIHQGEEVIDMVIGQLLLVMVLALSGMWLW